MTDTLDRALAALPHSYKGPGGAVAVLKDGQVLARHAWGWANAEQRLPFTPQTLFRICSISKQFTCSLLLDAAPDPSVLDDAVRAHLPLLEGPAPTAAHLAHNQSGLRDYWALAMLQGSPVEAPFGHAEARRLIAGTRSLHFAPGTQYSYCNQNFLILSSILEARGGRSYAELLRERIFQRIGMASAFVAADTSAMPDGTTGYEGSQASGFRAAVNHIFWTGDAGIGASLDDMIAWERHIDASRDDADALPSRISAPVSYADGSPAWYGFGLARMKLFGRDALGHAGALRGFRSFRLYIPAERVSVVVLFNHMADPYGAAMDLLAAVLGEARPAPATGPAAPDWAGDYLHPGTRLATRITALPTGQLKLAYNLTPELLSPRPDGGFGTEEGVAVVRTEAGVKLHRKQENDTALLQPAGSANGGLDIAGSYHCAELDSGITVAMAGGVPYAACSGPLGQGRMETLEPAGKDIWRMPCPRALDQTPPGDWTLALRRDATGQPTGMTVGCWLARGLEYSRG